MAGSKQQPVAVLSDGIPANITGPARQLLLQMVEGWVARRVGTKRHQQKTVDAAVRVLYDFFGFTGKIPGQLTPDDFDSWTLHVVRTRNINRATQRHYYSHVRQFLAYLLENQNLRNQARRLFNADIIQLVNEETSIPHNIERELDAEAEVGAFTHEEIEKFFDAIDRLIAFHHRHGTKKTLLPYLRDKALFSLMYTAGLRISEVSGIDLDSFEPNPEFPSFGQHGYVHVFGKGSKWRTVPILVKETAELLAACRDKIRPHQLSMTGDPNESAFFLSERGTRLSASGIYARFQLVLCEAGLEGTGLHPHMLRHSSVTHHGMAGMDIETLRQMHGHVYAATTQGYFNVPSQYIADDYSAATRRYLDDTNKEKP